MICLLNTGRFRFRIILISNFPFRLQSSAFSKNSMLSDSHNSSFIVSATESLDFISISAKLPSSILINWEFKSSNWTSISSACVTNSADLRAIVSSTIFLISSPREASRSRRVSLYADTYIRRSRISFWIASAFWWYSIMSSTSQADWIFPFKLIGTVRCGTVGFCPMCLGSQSSHNYF